jgi:hypothetical protein
MDIQGMFEKSSSINPLIKSSERTSEPKTNKKLQKGPILYRILKECRRYIQKLQLKFILSSNQQKKSEMNKSVPLASDISQHQ